MLLGICSLSIAPLHQMWPLPSRVRHAMYDSTRYLRSPRGGGINSVWLSNESAIAKCIIIILKRKWKIIYILLTNSFRGKVIYTRANGALFRGNMRSVVVWIVSFCQCLTWFLSYGTFPLSVDSHYFHWEKYWRWLKQQSCAKKACS